MDTKTLVVGQDVYMFSGCYTLKSKVVKVTPSGVDVQTGVMQNDGTWNAHELLHFDNNGRSYVTELPSSYDSTAHPLSPWGWDGNGTYECGPWELDDIPFEERESQMNASLRPICEWQEKARKAWEERYGGLSPEEYRAVLEEKAHKAREELSSEERQSYDRAWQKFSKG